MLVIVATIGSVLPGLISDTGAIEFVLRWPGITTILVLLMLDNSLSDLAIALMTQFATDAKSAHTDYGRIHIRKAASA